MIKDFEATKRQLTELSTLVNSFKSEAVQLKIVDHLFRSASLGPDGQEDSETSATTRKRARSVRRAAAPSAKATGRSDKRRAPKGKTPGPVGVLEDLLQRGFFKDPQTIGAVVERCRTNLARTFKASELSGPLGRFVRNEKLTRSKNADGQFQYIQK